MYSTSELFGKRVTGGLKRFLELYYGLTEKKYVVDLYSTDSPNSFRENNVSGYSLLNKINKKSIIIPAELKIMLSNIKTLIKIKKSEYEAIIVFDVPTAIGLCIFGLKNIQLFIRQDLISYKRISISNRTKNKTLLETYLKAMKLSESICLMRAERIIVQCKYDYNAILSRHKLISELIRNKTTVQINNVNPSWIRNNSENHNLDEDIMYIENPSEKFVIGFVGDFSNDRKGQRIFVDAIKDLLNDSFKIQAILIGDGNQLEDYMKECSGYADILFAGRVKNPIAIMKKCNLIVVPSLADSCPNTVMEALYNEIPVIGTYSGGIPEILESDIALFLPNSLSLQEKMEFFMNTDNLIKLKNHQKARKEELEFDWPSVMIEHMDIDTTDTNNSSKKYE